MLFLNKHIIPPYAKIERIIEMPVLRYTLYSGLFTKMHTPIIAQHPIMTDVKSFFDICILKYFLAYRILKIIPIPSANKVAITAAFC